MSSGGVPEKSPPHRVGRWREAPEGVPENEAKSPPHRVGRWREAPEGVPENEAKSPPHRVGRWREAPEGVPENADATRLLNRLGRRLPMRARTIRRTNFDGGSSHERKSAGREAALPAQRRTPRHRPALEAGGAHRGAEDEDCHAPLHRGRDEFQAGR